MRFASPSLWLLGAVAAVAIEVAGVTAAAAQVRLSTLDEVRREVTPGDVVTVTRTIGDPITGRLLAWGPTGLDIRPDARAAAGQRQRLDVTIPLADLGSLDRPRDSSRNGALIGAGVGGGVSVAMLVWAVSVDRNEIDEWGPPYLAGAGVATGIGAVLGWAIDRAHSKPHIRFDATPTRSARIHVGPVRARGRGIALAVSF